MAKNTTNIGEAVAGMRLAAREARVANLAEGRKLRAVKIAPKKGKGSYTRKGKYGLGGAV